MTRPATLTGPAARSSSSAAPAQRAWSGPAQCDTGKRVPNGSAPAARRSRSFSWRRRTSSLAETGVPSSPSTRVFSDTLPAYFRPANRNASMNGSMSPSITASTLPISTLVRWSLISW